MKTIESTTLLDCVNQESSITSEATTFPINGVDKDVIYLSLEEQGTNSGILLSPDDAEALARSIMEQVKYSKRKVSVIETNDDTYLSVESVIPTINGIPQHPEMAILMENEDGNEVVTCLTFKQVNELIYQLQRLIRQ